MTQGVRSVRAMLKRAFEPLQMRLEAIPGGVRTHGGERNACGTLSRATQTTFTLTHAHRIPGPIEVYKVRSTLQVVSLTQDIGADKHLTGERGLCRIRIKGRQQALW